MSGTQNHLHPEHLKHSQAMADRLAAHLAARFSGSAIDQIAEAGTDFWEKVRRSAGEDRVAGPETRAFTVAKLRELAAGKGEVAG